MHPKIAEKDGVSDIPSNHEGETAVTEGVERFLGSGGVCAHPASMEQEKRIRREVANSNERRRMQSINAGFLALRAMLPQREGEKLSKAAILQQTSDFICSLEQEKTRLLTQNCQLKRLLGPQSGGGGESPDPAAADSPAPPPPPPQSAVPRSTSQEELTACDTAHPAPPQEPQPLPLQTLQLELQELRAQLERERLQRLSAEERLRQAEQEQQQVEQERQQAEQELQQQQQQRQHQQHVNMGFKKLRLEPAASPQLLMAERHVMTPPAPEEPVRQTPPPPPVATRRPLYIGSTTSRQNLDTIVEAIRHLEGDHLFGDCSEPRQPRLEPAQTRLEPLPTHIEPVQTRLEPIQTRLEPIQTRLEPIQVRLESMHTHVEQVQARLEPIQARLEPMHTQMEPIQTRLEPIQTRLDPVQTRLEPLHGHMELQQPSCLELEPQEAPLELTTHARSCSVDPYRPAVIVAQHQPPRH